MSSEQLQMMKVFHTFNARRLSFVYNEMLRMNSSERKLAFKKLTNERYFIYRLNVDYAFYRYLQNLFNEQGWMRSHFEILSLLIILGLIRSDKATLKDVETFWQEERRKAIREKGRASEVPTERNTRRVFAEYYPEIFFTSNGEVQDNRQVPIATIFSLNDCSLDADVAAMAELVDDIELEQFTRLFGNPMAAREELEQRTSTCCAQRLIDPSDLEGLTHYGARIVQRYRAVVDRFGPPPEEFQWLEGSMKRGDRAVESIYHFINSAILLRWFRKMDPDQQWKKTNARHPLKYTQQDGERAIMAFRRWFTDDHIATQHFWMAADEYGDRLLRYDISIDVMKALLARMPMDERDMAITYHNLGYFNRRLGHFKLAAGAFNRSRELWEAVNSPLDLSIVLGYCAETSHISGDTARSNKILGEALDLLRGLKDEPQKVYAVRHVLNAASGMRAEGVACEVADIGMRLTEKGEQEYQILFYPYFLGMWLYWSADPIARAGLIPPRPPPEFRFHKTESNSHIPHVYTRKYEPSSVERAADFVSSR